MVLIDNDHELNLLQPFQAGVTQLNGLVHVPRGHARLHLLPLSGGSDSEICDGLPLLEGLGSRKGMTIDVVDHTPHCGH